jgi:hypothetical protein
LETRLAQAGRGLLVAALSLAREILNREVYGPAVDVSSTGRPKWRRTGALKRGEVGEVRGPTEVAVVNRVAYAEPRHEAGKPGRRRINPLRVSHWRDEMAKVMRPIAQESWADAVRDAMRRS